MKDLCLVWRQYICYGCCDRCVILSAKYEADKYFQCTFKTDTLHDIVGCPLQDIDIRCYYCLSPLTLVEKCDLIARNKPTCLIRGYYRAPCADCIKKEIY